MSKAKTRTLCILLGILVLVGAATFAVSRYEEKVEEIKNSDEIILAIPTESVTALAWEYDDTALAFHCDEGWLWDDDETFPVDDSVIEKLLGDFESFGVAFVIENVTDYSQYGLDDPTAEIHITAGDDEYDIKLGAFSTMDEERYVSIGDGNVYLASSDPMDDFELTISDLILHDEIPSISQAASIEFTGDTEYKIYYSEAEGKSWCEDDVYYTDDKPLDTSVVKKYLSSMHSLSLTDYVSYNVTEDELAEFGLDTPELTVSVVYEVEDEDSDDTHEETFVLNVGRNAGELADASAAAEDSDEEADLSGVTAYVRVGESQIVYEITSSEYEKLAAMTYDDLRHQKIMTADFDDVYQIDVTLEGKTYSITSETGEDEETVWSYGDAEDISISDIKNDITGMTADSFTDSADKGKREIEVTLYLDSEEWPQIVLSLYRCDGSTCLAVINGETVAYVPRDQVVELIEAVNAIVLN